MAHAVQGTDHKHAEGSGRPYLLFWINMVLGLAVMYIVMFSMIDGVRDFRNNLNMFYMALTMWAPMGIFMLATMPYKVQTGNDQRAPGLPPCGAVPRRIPPRTGADACNAGAGVQARRTGPCTPALWLSTPA